MDFEKVKKWIDHNRFAVVGLMLAVILFVGGVACTPEVVSPVSGRPVTAIELEIEWNTTLAKYEAAVADLERQAVMQGKFQELILSVASGGITEWGSLANLFISGGFLGFMGDNIRKRGLIAGLKKRKR